VVAVPQPVPGKAEMVAPSGRSPPEIWAPTSEALKLAETEDTQLLEALVTPSVTARFVPFDTRTCAPTLFVQLPVAGPGLAGHSGPPARVALLRVTVVNAAQPVPETAATLLMNVPGAMKTPVFVALEVANSMLRFTSAAVMARLPAGMPV